MRQVVDAAGRKQQSAARHVEDVVRSTLRRGEEARAVGAGKACAAGKDCQSGLCTAGKCTTASCTDHAKNGMETGVDCGGPSCGACPDGQGCTTAAESVF